MIRKRHTMLIAVALAAALVTVVAGCGSDSESGANTDTTEATAQAPKKQPVVTGTFDGAPVTYFDFGDIALEADNTTGGMWTVTNGASGQQAIFDSVPGNPKYAALRTVSEVTWAAGKTPRLLASTAAVTAAETAGDVTVAPTDRVVNAPILEFGQKRHQGFAKDQAIEYYELGTIKVAPGNEVLPIWTFTNGVEGQANIADVEPGTTAYTPLWAPIEVTWSETATPRLLKSFEDMKAAETAGELTLKPVPDTVVNCPFL